MNIPLLVFNLVFYGVLIGLYAEARHDPSSSLGIGFAMLFVIIIFPILQLILWKMKVIKVRTVADKIAFVTATPLIPLIIMYVMSQNLQ